MPRSHSSSSYSSHTSSGSSSSSYTSSTSRSRSRSPLSSKLIVKHLTGNVNKAHLLEIFGQYGALKSAEVAIKECRDGALKRGFGFVEYEERADAEDAVKFMDGGQIDGAEIRVEFVRRMRRRRPPARYRRGRYRRNYTRRRRSYSYSSSSSYSR